MDLLAGYEIAAIANSRIWGIWSTQRRNAESFCDRVIGVTLRGGQGIERRQIRVISKKIIPFKSLISSRIIDHIDNVG